MGSYVWSCSLCDTYTVDGKLCVLTYISTVLLIISLTFRSLGSLTNLIALLNQDQFLSSVRGHQAWIYNKY